MKSFVLFIFFTFFYFFPSFVFASKNDLINKLNQSNIYKKEINKSYSPSSLSQEERQMQAFGNNQQARLSFDELKKQEIIPDLIIGVNASKISDQEIDKLINKLNDLKNQGKKIDYFTDDKLVGVYIYLYGSEEKYKELKDELVSESIKISPNRKLVKQYTPNDSYYSYQWNLTNINWSQAMDIGIGSNPVTIGIIDNGVDVDDLDLSSNIWQNPNETYGDLDDDDGNGYIDDKYGCNFYMRIIEGNTYFSCRKSYIKEGYSKHGTYVAQVAASVTNNSLGIAGVCPNCKIAALKITYYDYYYSDDIGDFTLLPYVFSYAANKGIKVLNFSMGRACPFDVSQDVFTSDINNLINNYGIMLIQAAGNNGSMTQSQCISQCGSSNPYCYSSARNQAYYYVEGKNVPNKINVAAINSSNQRASFSVYDGSNPVITIAAPGVNIPVYPYKLVSGTSFAAPMVTGTSGFILTLNNNLSPSQIYNLIKDYSNKYLPGLDNINKLNLLKIRAKLFIDANQSSSYVYRIWRRDKLIHFYSIFTSEIDAILRNDYYDNWIFEGPAYIAFTSVVENSIPLYRFYRTDVGVHFYTANEQEKNSIINNPNAQGIWNYEGISYYVYPNIPNLGSRNVYRFWRNDVKAHFYTASEEEKNSIVNNPNATGIWILEGVAWRVP